MSHANAIAQARSASSATPGQPNPSTPTIDAGYLPIPCEIGRGLAERLGYAPEQLDRAPALAVTSFAGVGYHLDLAGLRPGEQIADLQCGAGLDTFLAALHVGKGGHVHAIESSPALQQKARALRSLTNATQVTVHAGSPEALPMPDESLTCVIGNGITRRAENPTRAFEEAARVLRPGGRIALSDLVAATHLPSHVASDPYARAAGIAGATHRREYQEALTAAGFSLKLVQINSYQHRSDVMGRLATQYGVRSISLVATRR